jgi:hypothetical protein
VNALLSLPLVTAHPKDQRAAQAGQALLAVVLHHFSDLLRNDCESKSEALLRCERSCFARCFCGECFVLRSNPCPAKEYLPKRVLPIQAARAIFKGMCFVELEAQGDHSFSEYDKIERAHFLFPRCPRQGREGAN